MGNIQLGVNTPIINRKFQKFEQTVFFKNNETSTGSSKTLELADEDGVAINPQAAPFCVNAGNVIILGPSSHTDNPEMTEQFTIDSTTTAAIIGTLKYKYMAEDPIAILTVPKGWTGEATQVLNKLYSRSDGLRFGGGSAKTYSGYGAKISRGVTTIVTTQWNFLNQASPDHNTKGGAFYTMNGDFAHGVEVRGVIRADFSTAPAASKIYLRIWCQDDPAGKTLTMYRVKKSYDYDSITWNDFATANPWDAAGCYTSGVDYHAGAVFSAALNGSGFHTLELDATLMNEIIGGTPAKTNYGLILSVSGTTTVNIDMDYAGYEPTFIIVPGSDDTHSISTQTEANTFLNSNGVHRLALYAKTTGTYGRCYVVLKEYDGAGSLKATNSHAINAQLSSYTLASFTFTPHADTKYGVIELKIKSAITAATTFEAACLIVTHAAGTSDTASGIWIADKQVSFPARPNKIDGVQRNQSRSTNSIDRYDPSGGKVRWGYSTAEFKNITFAQYDDLLLLEEYALALNEITMISGDASMPQILIGDMKLSAPYYLEASHARVCVTMLFEEV